jgi:sodium transport system permease protein
VFRKELTDHLRDRRSVATSLLMPLLGPLVFFLLFSLLAQMLRQDKPLRVPARGLAQAHSLAAFLEQGGVELLPAPTDLEAEVRDGRADVALVLPDGFAEAFAAGRGARVEVLADTSRNKARPAVQRLLRLLHAYSGQLGGLRLLARGVDPRLAVPLAIEEQDLATPERTAANVLTMVPLFLLLSIFMGGMYLAIDCTAGERERGSLEPLLLNPVSRAELVLGKWGAVLAVSWGALLVSLLAFAAALARVPMQEIGLRVLAGPRELLGMALVLLPLSLFAAALQLNLALYSRSFKEAQTWLSLVTLLPMLPAALLAVSPLQPQAWMMAVPALSQTLLLTEGLRGGAVPFGWHLAALASSAGCAGLCLAGAVRLISQERIIYGRS